MGKAMETRPAVPDAVAAAWGVRDRTRRKGPKPALTLSRIVQAAIRVADAEGLEAISMARVAAEAGTAPMSLYRHVSGKEQLLELMGDGAWGTPPPPPAPGESWREGLSRWAWTMRRATTRHPWAARLPITSLPVLPNQVAWFENALACMRDAGLSEARKASVIMLLSGCVRNLAVTEMDVAAAIRDSGLAPDAWMAGYGTMLRELTDAERFPALAAFLDAGVFDIADPPEDEFVFGLERILDGVAALIERGR
jgi:AcrR family transcriptional regulator